MKSARVVSAVETGTSTVANGQAINKVRLLVQDEHGNTVSNASVRLSTADSALSFTTDRVMTGSDGYAIVGVMSTKKCPAQIFAIVENASKTLMKLMLIS